MNRGEAWFVHASFALVGGTGLVYAWLRYATTPVDPYAVVNHPWQPMLQHLHVWTAPFLVFCAGLIWRKHIWAHFRSGVPDGRRSGIALILSLMPMVLSGYLIQTAVDETWRTIWVTTHLVSSALWLGGYGGHVWAQLRRRRRAENRKLYDAVGNRAADAGTNRAAEPGWERVRDIRTAPLSNTARGGKARQQSQS